MCERSGVELDTSVIGQLLSLFKNEEHFIFSTLSPLPGRMKYVNQHTHNDTVKSIVLTLCDNSHFFGYIVDIKKRHIICIDSMYQPKTGQRSIGVNLKEKYFGSTNGDVSFTSCYEIRVQTDGSSCGAWLIAGIVGYLLEIEMNSNKLTRARVFDLLIILIDDLEFDIKCIKSLQSFNDSQNTYRRKKYIHSTIALTIAQLQRFLVRNSHPLKTDI